MKGLMMVYYHQAAVLSGHGPVSPADVVWVEHDATGLINSIAREVERRVTALEEYGEADTPSYYLSPITLVVQERDDEPTDQEWAWGVLDQWAWSVNVVVRRLERRPFDVWLKKMRHGYERLSFREVENRLIAARIKWAGLKESAPYHQGDIDRAKTLVDELIEQRRIKDREKIEGYSFTVPE